MKTKHRNAAFSGILSLLIAALLATCQSAPPEVTSADPPFAEQGAQDLDVTITGVGFEPGAEVKIVVHDSDDSGGVTVHSTRFVDSNTLLTNIDVNPDATTGSFDVEVQVSGRTGKGIEVFGVAPGAEAAAPQQAPDPT